MRKILLTIILNILAKRLIIEVSNFLIKFLITSFKICDCYFQLHDWNELNKWQEKFKVDFLDIIENKNLKELLESRIDVNYIK